MRCVVVVEDLSFQEPNELRMREECSVGVALTAMHVPSAEGKIAVFFNHEPSTNFSVEIRGSTAGRPVECVQAPAVPPELGLKFIGGYGVIVDAPGALREQVVNLKMGLVDSSVRCDEHGLDCADHGACRDSIEFDLFAFE